ncbi:ralA-binding protein 1 [Daktulosphaira vitifoliae]|uniref:ralA-binding protein 1 n=1 Tax=Daktulosphaira vitifoliae TaxID=58002 RepID=UPI0021A9C264|nr:ralA-binding protein 1 [Daktulosphaira vitifoliae]
MDFDSPDVEKDFPGLYASSDVGHKDSDGKRKDKKDRGYAALEGESSPEEEPNAKSPSKIKKIKPFKFTSKKEKHDRIKDKDSKEEHKDKKKDGEKMKKKEKSKEKIKDKRKQKNINGKTEIDTSALYENQPIFGVPLELSFERNPCHDDIHLPLVLRNCIDYVQLNGLCTDGVYKVPGTKSKVQNLKIQYNRRQSVNLSEYDLAIVTSLLKQYLRELPDPILTTNLLSKFESCAESRNVDSTKILISELPSCNRDTFTWLIVHFTNIIENEKYTKMNIVNFGTVLCPVLQMSSSLFSFVISKRNELFPNAILPKYIPPLRCASPYLPSSKYEMSVELKKQESLLGYIHREMNAGFVSKTKEEELWDVQRIITQLKRKLKVIEKDSNKTDNEKKTTCIGTYEEVGTQTVLDRQSSENSTSGHAEVVSITSDTANTSNCEDSLVDEEIQTSTSDSDNDELVLQYESEELLSMIANLKDSIIQEKCEINRLASKLKSIGKYVDIRNYFIQPIQKISLANNSLVNEYKILELQRNTLLKSIVEEREAIIDLKIQIKLAQRKHIALA